MAFSTGEYLSRHNIDETAIQIVATVTTEGNHHAHSAQFSVQSTDDYLKRCGIGKTDFATGETRSRLTYALSARMIALWSLIVPMAIVPFWLMALVSLPAFGVRDAYSEPMENAFLAALVSDCAGLYYVITRNLLPPSKED